jgi:hypothetical protein
MPDQALRDPLPPSTSEAARRCSSRRMPSAAVSTSQYSPARGRTHPGGSANAVCP